MPLDMVLDRNSNPAWCGTPEATAKWLRYQIEARPVEMRGYYVRTGWPQRMMTISQYLNESTEDE